MRESISTLRDLLTRSEFQIGIVLGAIALALLAIGPRRPRWARPWAFVATVAVVAGVQIVDGDHHGLFVGVGFLAVGGALIGSARSTTDGRMIGAFGWAIAASGAALIPWKGRVDPDAWFFFATPAVALGFGAALSTWDRTAARRWVGPLIAITAFAIWTTVPDTEQARLLLGIALPLAFGTLPTVSASLTTAGTFALGGVLAWLPALGGEARSASIVGAWASFGVIILVPLAALLWPMRRIGTTTTFVLHATITLVAARVIGLWTWAVPATIAVVSLYAVGLAVVYWSGSDASVNPGC